jgi:hypothetical protein
MMQACGEFSLTGVHAGKEEKVNTDEKYLSQADMCLLCEPMQFLGRQDGRTRRKRKLAR